MARAGARSGELSRFLVTRGLWLIAIEFTVVRFGWMFAFNLDYFIMQVIFAIGASMVVLAALVHLPRWAIATIGVVLIAGHNAARRHQGRRFRRARLGVEHPAPARAAAPPPTARGCLRSIR